MRKTFYAAICAAISILLFSAAGKYPDKVIIYGYDDTGTGRVMKMLEKEKLKYVFYDLSVRNDKYGEFSDKMRIFDENLKNYTFPVLDVNGNMIVSQSGTFEEIKKFLNSSSKDGGSGRIQGKINAVDIVYAIKNSDALWLEKLLECGADPNVPHDYHYLLKDMNGTLEKKVDEVHHVFDIIDNKNLKTEKKLELLSILYRHGMRTDIKNGRNVTALQFILTIYDYSYKTRRDEALELFKLVAGCGAGIDEADSYGNTALSKAAAKGDIEFMKYLLSKGADINHRNDYGSTALESAVAVVDIEKEKETIKFLADRGIDINARGYMGQTLLYTFVNGQDKSAEKFDVLKFIISLGADVDLGDDDGVAPLTAAKGNKIFYDYLLSLGAKPYEFTIPAKNSSPLYDAIKNADITALKKFPPEDFYRIRCRTSDGIPATMLHVAAEEGSIEVIKAFCSLNVNWNSPDRYKRTPLLIAVMNGRNDVVELLMKNGADPNRASSYGLSPYVYAAGNNPVILDLFLDSGIKPDNADVLLVAEMYGSLDAVKKLYPFFAKEENESFVNFAVDYGYTDIVKYITGKQDAKPEASKAAIEKSEMNNKRFNEYTAKNGKLLKVERKSEGISEKKGNFQYTVEEWSPFTNEKAGLDLSKLPLGIHVPPGYDGSKPYGLLLFISWNYPGEGYRKILEKYNIIWAGFDCYKIDYKPFEDERKHEIFCLAAVYNLLKYFNIDRNRIYMGGMSWGGRLTGRIIHRYPDVFKGGIATDGCLTDNWDDKNKIFLPCFRYSLEKTPIAVTTGDYDFNKYEAYHMYNYYLTRAFKTMYIQAAGRAHESLLTEDFEKAVIFLDSYAGRK